MQELSGNVLASVDVHNTPTAELIAQLEELQTSISQDEAEDKVNFKAEIAQLEQKLETVRMIVRGGPERLYELRQRIDRERRKANETALDIQTLRSRQGEIEEELNLAHAAAQAHQQQHLTH